MFWNSDYSHSGIEYDISPDGKSVLVKVGHTARARMLLAEKGLPRSASAGYELLQKPIKPAELRSLMAHVLA